jgi:hypothetical protein
MARGAKEITQIEIDMIKEVEVANEASQNFVVA